MKNRVLALRPDCMTDPMRGDLVPLEAIMLWPGDKDEASRAECENTVKIQFGIELAGTLPNGSLQSDEFLQLASAAAMVTPLNDIRERAQNKLGGPFVKGFIAGRVLLTALERAPRGKMPSIYTDVAKSFAPVWNIAAKSIESRVWPDYRCVSHFWAAWILTESSGENPRFPCAVCRLPAFLRIAIAIQRQAENTRPVPNAKHPIFVTGEAVSLGFDIQ